MNESFFIIQILLSATLGAIIGWQREHVGRAAGSRTFALVSLGSTLFTLLSVYGFSGTTNITHIAGQILTGIGFIGAGTIIHKQGGTEGLTTAAGLWASAAVGMAVAVNWYWQAVFVTLVMFFILLVQDKKWFK